MNESGLWIMTRYICFGRTLKIIKLSSYRMDVFKKGLKTLKLSYYRMDVFKKGLKTLKSSYYRMDVFKKGSKRKKLIIYIVVFDNGIEWALFRGLIHASWMIRK